MDRGAWRAMVGPQGRKELDMTEAIETQGSDRCPRSSRAALGQSDGISVSLRAWRVPDTLQRSLCNSRSHRERPLF